MTDKIVKGDDTGFGGGSFLEVEILNENNIPISKAEVMIGNIKKTYNNPDFPLRINLTAEETRKLHASNNCYMKVYDGDGLGETCEGTLRFEALNEVVK